MTSEIRYKRSSSYKQQTKKGFLLESQACMRRPRPGSRQVGRWAPLPRRRWGLRGQDAACLERRRSRSRRAACASSWHLPMPPQHVLGASGRNRQPALPSFLMQFANGCKDTAKPERDWEPEPLRLPQCRRDVCCREAAQRCGTGEPAEPGLACSVLRCWSPWQIGLGILTGETRLLRSPEERWFMWWQARG